VRRKLLVVAAVIVVIVGTISTMFGLVLIRPLPTLDADLRLLGLNERAEVLRDKYGVPHIFAMDEHDVFFVQGYVTAQDRLWQMDLLRTLGLGRAARLDLTVISDEARGALEAGPATGLLRCDPGISWYVLHARVRRNAVRALLPGRDQGRRGARAFTSQGHDRAVARFRAAVASGELAPQLTDPLVYAWINGRMRPSEYREITKRTAPSATRDLAQAMRAGYLTVAGETKSRRYSVGPKLQAVQPLPVSNR
jgi:penicillin amidase